MAKQVALLRGINVGGNNMIPMADLRAMFESLGYADTKTLLQSGNVVFDAGKQKPAALEQSLNAATKKRFGFDIDYIVRSASEWSALIAANPFPDEAKRDPSHLLVTCMKERIDSTNVTALQAAIQGPELVRAVGRDLYTVYPIGIGVSKLTPAMVDKHLRLRGTARNWNTVQKIAALL